MSYAPYPAVDAKADGLQEQIEARYKAQEELLRSDINNLTEQAETRALDIRRLQTNVETLKLSNEELNVSLPCYSYGYTAPAKFVIPTIIVTVVECS